MARAEPMVAEAKTSAAFIPAACIASISAYTLGPGAVPGLPASVPMAIGIWAAYSAARLRALRGGVESIRAMRRRGVADVRDRCLEV